MVSRGFGEKCLTSDFFGSKETQLAAPQLMREQPTGNYGVVKAEAEAA